MVMASMPHSSRKQINLSIFSFQNLGKKRIYMDALRRIMFLKQVSYNWYLFRDITHSKAQNGTQR